MSGQYPGSDPSVQAIHQDYQSSLSASKPNSAKKVLKSFTFSPRVPGLTSSAMVLQLEAVISYALSEGAGVAGIEELSEELSIGTGEEVSLSRHFIPTLSQGHYCSLIPAHQKTVSLILKSRMSWNIVNENQCSIVTSCFLAVILHRRNEMIGERARHLQELHNRESVMFYFFFLAFYMVSVTSSFARTTDYVNW